MDILSLIININVTHIIDKNVYVDYHHFNIGYNKSNININMLNIIILKFLYSKVLCLTLYNNINILNNLHGINISKIIHHIKMVINIYNMDIVKHYN